MNLDDYSIEEMRRGYRFDEEAKTYRCLACNAVFEEGEVYPEGTHFYLAQKAIRQHVINVHPGYVRDLIHHESKYNGLTDNQKQLMELFALGKSDKDIAKELGLSTSTIRHQKFMFREKAKQAKFYLSVYESVFSGNKVKSDVMMPIHEHAKMVDMRYVITEQERQKVLNTYFTSLDPLIMKEFPAREKKKVAALTRICEEFSKEKKYTEKEINDVLSAVYHDYPTVRRYLIQYGFMTRSKDGSWYERT